jgi:hypothetical protein
MRRQETEMACEQSSDFFNAVIPAIQAEQEAATINEEEKISKSFIADQSRYL